MTDKLDIAAIREAFHVENPDKAEIFDVMYEHFDDLLDEHERLTAELTKAHELRAQWEQAAIKYQRERSHATEALIRMYNPTQRAKVEKVVSVADEFHEKWERGEKERDRLTAELAEQVRRTDMLVALSKMPQKTVTLAVEQRDLAREQRDTLARLLEKADKLAAHISDIRGNAAEFDRMQFYHKAIPGFVFNKAVELHSEIQSELAALKGQEGHEP